MPFRRSLTLSITLLLSLAVIIAAFTGCAPREMPPPAWEMDAAKLLDQADDLYTRKQFDQAANTVGSFFTLYPKSRYADRALMILGDSRMAQRDYRQAADAYRTIVVKHRSSSFVPEARYRLGRSYFELKDYDGAIEYLEDRTKITDPARLVSISEMLSGAYFAKQNYPLAVREYVYLALNAPNARQQAGYRERVREIIERNMNEDDLRKIASSDTYPADIALLRLASLFMEQHAYRGAISASRDFLEKFPLHPEKTRAEMLLNQATSGLTGPRFFVGALVPQTGQLAFFGDRVLKGALLAAHTFNLENPENRVELIIRDTEGLPEKAVTAVTELAAARVAAGLGPITLREEEAVIPLLENSRIPFIRPASSRSGFNGKSGWIFRNALTIDSQAAAAAQYAIDMNLKRFVLLYPDEPYGKDLSQLFAKQLNRKAHIAANIAYPPDTKDFGPYIRKILEIDLRSRKIPIPEKEADRKKLFAGYKPGFDGIYLPGTAERVGLLIPQLAFYNITRVAMIGSDNWHYQDLIERAGKYAEGAVFVDGFFAESDDPAVRAFVEGYRSAYQEEPDVLSAQAYDSAMIIFTLLKEGKETPLAIRDGLLNLRNYKGVTGLTSFNGSHDARKAHFLIKIEDGRFTSLNPE